MAKKKYGTCLLLGHEANLVKCHILPQSLTKPSEKGAPLWQASKGVGPKRRWSSWYDDSIVSREGEDYLSRIDDDAIKALRRHKLIWSGWYPFTPVFERITPSSPDHSLRTVRLGADAAIIHKFALSIAWRASVSRLPEMSNINLGADVEGKLRALILGKTTLTPAAYPTGLIQISCIGEAHNLTPIRDKKIQPAIDDIPEKHLDMVRIYVDGLIMHVHLNPDDLESYEDNPLILGASEKHTIVGISYQASFQYDNMLVNAYETYLGPLNAPMDQQA